MSRVTENLQGVIKQTLDRNGNKLSLSLGTKVKEGSVVTGSWSENSKRGTPVRSSHSQTAVHQRGNWENKHPDLTFNHQITYQNLPLAKLNKKQENKPWVSILAHRARWRVESGSEGKWRTSFRSEIQTLVCLTPKPLILSKCHDNFISN